MRPVIVEVSSIAKSAPIRTNWRGTGGSFGISMGVDLNPGALTYTVEHTFDDPADFSSAADYNSNATWRATTGLTALAATGEGNIAFPVQAVRLNVTAYTSGSAELTVTQAS